MVSLNSKFYSFLVWILIQKDNTMFLKGNFIQKKRKKKKKKKM